MEKLKKKHLKKLANKKTKTIKKTYIQKKKKNPPVAETLSFYRTRLFSQEKHPYLFKKKTLFQKKKLVFFEKKTKNLENKFC